MRTISVIVICAALLMAGALPAWAADQNRIEAPAAPSIPPPAASRNDPAKDQALESLNRAGKAYQDGKYKEALKLTDQAQASIRAKHAELYRALLPPAPGGGWKAEEKTDSSATLGAQAVGGLSLVARAYVANGHKVTITYLIDSPMLALMSNLAQIVTSSADADSASAQVKGNKALYREIPAKNKTTSHQVMIYAGDMIVTVQSTTLGKDTLMQFANIVDYDGLKAVP